MEEVGRGFTRAFNPINYEHDAEILNAVASNNLIQFKSSVDLNRSRHASNALVLYYVVKHHRPKMFDYLLDLKGFNPDCCDNIGRSTLMKLAALPSGAYYARKLIEHGADVNLADSGESTYLHMAAKEAKVDNVKVAQIVIEHGANINARNKYGETPLYVACLYGNIDLVSVLMFYNADPTIASKRVLPIAATCNIWIGRLNKEIQDTIHALLFDYTFDNGPRVNLRTVVKTMTSDTELFPKLVSINSRIVYKDSDLIFFMEKIRYMKVQHIKLFISTFGDIFKKMIADTSLLRDIFELHRFGQYFEDIKPLLDVLLYSNCVADLINYSDPSFPYISVLMTRLIGNNPSITEDVITPTICQLLSYGLDITAVDVESVFKRYGYCKLFKILLHMDIKVRRLDIMTTIAAFCCNIHWGIEDLLALPNISHWWGKYDPRFTLLKYFNHSGLKDICLEQCKNEEIVDVIRKMPQVPSLLELSRHMARRYIVMGFNVSNSRQFHTALNALPIANIYKEIISFERALYSLD